NGPGTHAHDAGHVRVLAVRVSAVGSGETVVPPPAAKALEYLSYEYSDDASSSNGCHYSWEGARWEDPFFRVQRLDVTDAAVSMEMSIGTAHERIALHCPGPPAFDGPPVEIAGAYNHAFYTLHANEALSLNAFKIQGWSLVGGSLYARKTYART